MFGPAMNGVGMGGYLAQMFGGGQPQINPAWQMGGDGAYHMGRMSFQMPQQVGGYGGPQSPGLNFLLGHLASRGWSPQQQPIQGYGNLMGSGGFNNFMGAMTSRFGAPSAAYQGYLQSLQERRDARAGVPQVPPQGPTSPSAQRRVPAMMAGRSY